MKLVDKIIKKAVGYLSKQRFDPVAQPANFERLRHEIRPCDVVLVEGNSHVANVIRTITQSRWSHSALYIGRLHDIEDPVARQHIKKVFDAQPDTQLVVESELGFGTVIRPLNVYQNRPMRLCRPKLVGYSDAQVVLSQAISRIGTDYDLRQILDLARLLMPWSFMPRRFRSTLFGWSPGQYTRTVCSTMIAEAFGSIKYPILPLVKKLDHGEMRLFQRNPRLTVPADFDYSPYFDIIKFPYIDLERSSTEHYKGLPWHGDIELTVEESKQWVAIEAFEPSESRHARRPTRSHN